MPLEVGGGGGGGGGDNYIKKEGVVSLAHSMSTGPPLHPYQILSNYLKQMKVMACIRFWLQGR